VQHFRATSTLSTSSGTMQYNTVGCALHVDASKFNRSGLTELTWTSDILEYSSFAASDRFMMRLDSMFVGFMGRGNGTATPPPFFVVATAVQNLRHSFSDDSMQIPNPHPALGIYLSSVQPTLSDSQHGVRLNANTGAFPEYGRNFSNVNGMGYSARNIYS